jgi:AcrR family transcriptional regulator
MIQSVHMSSPMAPAAAPPARSAAATEARILDAAELCVARLGLRRVSVSDVARQAGLSRGAVYLHFGDRAALVDALLARTAARFVARSEDAVRRRRTLETQVAEAAVFIRTHLGDALVTLRLPDDETPAIAAVLSAQIERLVAAWVEFWHPLLAEAESRGELRQGLDHRQAGEWIVRILVSFAFMPAVTFDADDPEAVRGFVRAHLTRGLAPSAAPRAGAA